MSEVITIEYKPILGTTITNIKKFSLNTDQIFGMIIMASIASSPEYITIKLQNGDIVDMTQISTLPYFGNNKQFDYAAKFFDNVISFDNIDFIQGSVKICLLLGIDPSSVITNITRMGSPIKLDFGRYIGMISILNSTEFVNGSVVSLKTLEPIMGDKMVDSLSRSLNQCFPGTTPGFIVPAEMYIITTDENRSDIIASAAATLYSPSSIGNNIGAYYIFNVCTDTNIRGEGLSKTVMISMVNDLAGKGHNKFILEVLSTNDIAYALYKSLGFYKVSDTQEGDSIYDILYLMI